MRWLLTLMSLCLLTQLKAAVAAGDQIEIDRIKAENTALASEEAALLPEEDKGITVFRKKDNALILMDFMVRGFLKQAAEAVSGIWGIRSKIDKWVFVKERTIPIHRNGAPIAEADGKLERVLRAQTMQGPCTTLACSEKVEPGATAEFTIMVLPLGVTKAKIDADTLKSWLAYGELSGLGQWRSGSYGRFTSTVEELV